METKIIEIKIDKHPFENQYINFIGNNLGELSLCGLVSLCSKIDSELRNRGVENGIKNYIEK